MDALNCLPPTLEPRATDNVEASQSSATLQHRLWLQARLSSWPAAGHGVHCGEHH